MRFLHLIQCQCPYVSLQLTSSFISSLFSSHCAIISFPLELLSSLFFFLLSGHSYFHSITYCSHTIHFHHLIISANTILSLNPPIISIFSFSTLNSPPFLMIWIPDTGLAGCHRCRGDNVLVRLHLASRCQRWWDVCCALCLARCSVRVWACMEVVYTVYPYYVSIFRDGVLDVCGVLLGCVYGVCILI